VQFGDEYNVEKKCQTGKWSCFWVVLGARVRGLTPISGCHSIANFAATSMMFILVKIYIDI
jgi:hypothetical protein